MELDARLRAFAAVARRGSFSRAAGELFVSQPAVSKQVALLELELGRTLVTRGARGASLTEAGRILADYVLRAEALLANGRRALESSGVAGVGTLALAASGTPGLYVLPTVIGRFHELHPGVEIRFDLATTEGALELVRAHKAELGVVGRLAVPPELESELLLIDEIVLVGAPAYAGRRWGLRELEQLTWVRREAGSATRAATEAAATQMGVAPPRTLDLPSWEAIKLAVAGGAGIAAVSRIAIDVELKAGTLVILDAPRWRASREIAVAVARDVPLTPPAEHFLALLRETRRET